MVTGKRRWFTRGIKFFLLAALFFQWPTVAMGAAKPPSLAILPFVPMQHSSHRLARRMRFAVGKKMSRNGHFHRLQDHNINMMIDALQIPWTKPVTTQEVQKVISALAVDQAVMGYVDHRKLKLELFRGTKLVRTVSGQIPSDNTSPRLAVEKLLTELDHIQFHHVSEHQVNRTNPVYQQLFKTRPNLVFDPRFRQAANGGGVAKPWSVFLLKQDYHPPLVSNRQAAALPNNRVVVVRQSYVDARISPARRYCLMMHMGLGVAQSNGLAAESAWIPVTQGDRYRVSVTYHSDAPRIRIFVKGFAYWPDQFSRPGNLASQRREIYRAQLLPVTAHPGWRTTEMDFVPMSIKSQRKQYPIRWVRIDLFVYLNKGNAFFRDITLKNITSKK